MEEKFTEIQKEKRLLANILNNSPPETNNESENNPGSYASQSLKRKTVKINRSTEL